MFKKGVNVNLFILVVVLVFLAGLYGASYWTVKRLTVPVQNTSGDYRLINKVVTANLGKYFIINFKSLKEQFFDIQRRYSQKTYIYFLYLNNGSWVGMNERENFTAASVVKVPLAMAAYKAVEEGKLSLEQEYTLSELDLNDAFGELYKVGADQSFTILELLAIMLERSDNTAQEAIFNTLKEIGIQDPLAEVYQFFGWVLDVGETPNFRRIDLKTLSNMFVALYNAKYVNVEHSQQILDHLTRSSFNDKIVAGVPQGVDVAHKIGTSAGDETYSDCGIVYVPNRHYLLCIGSSGADEKIAARFMKEISAAAYNYVIKN